MAQSFLPNHVQGRGLPALIGTVAALVVVGVLAVVAAVVVRSSRQARAVVPAHGS